MKKRFLFYAMINLIILSLILIDLIVIGNHKIFSLFPIISIIIFLTLIIRFERIAFQRGKINSSEEWYYNTYNRDCIIVIVVMLLIRLFINNS